MPAGFTGEINGEADGTGPGMGDGGPAATRVDGGGLVGVDQDFGSLVREENMIALNDAPAAADAAATIASVVLDMMT